jgi:molybdopterin synthase catalytic subunit
MKEPTWKKELRERATNPEFGKERLLAIINELDNRDTPDLGYIRSKLQAFDEFLEDIKKAQTIWKEEKLKKTGV